MVVQGALVVIRVLDLLVAAEQLLRELEHIVGIAGFRPLDFLHHRAKVVFVVEVLLDAVAADGHRALVVHGLPKELRRLLPVAPARQCADALEADDFRDLRIRMQARQLVLAGRQRLQDRLVREAHGQVQILLLARHRIDVGQHLVHAAVLGAQHGLHLCVGERGRQFHGPVRQGHQHGFRLDIAGVLVGVAQAGKYLVQVVPRHPTTVDGKGVGLQLATGHGLPGGAAIGNAAQVAIAIRVLALLQLRQHVVEAFARLGVARGRHHQRQRRQIMPAHVAVQARRFPVAIAGLNLRQARLAAERRQQFVRVKRHQILQVRRLCVEKRSRTEAHGREGKQLGRLEQRRGQAAGGQRQHQHSLLHGNPQGLAGGNWRL